METEYDFIDTNGLSTGDVIRVDCYNKGGSGGSGGSAGLFFYIEFIQNSPFGSIPDVLSNPNTTFLDLTFTYSAYGPLNPAIWNLSDPVSVQKIGIESASWVWNSMCANYGSCPTNSDVPISFYIPIGTTPTPTPQSSISTADCNQVTLYQLWDGSHTMESTSNNEASPTYKLIGPIGNICSNPAQGTTALYRGFNASQNEHMDSLSLSELAANSFIPDFGGNPMGYVYTSQVGSTWPVYRFGKNSCCDFALGDGNTRNG